MQYYIYIILLTVFNTSTASICYVYNEICQCNVADMGVACLWCPTTNKCLQRGDEWDCTTSENVIKESNSKCTNTTNINIAHHLPVTINGKQFNGLTDETHVNSAVLLHKDVSTFHLDLQSIFTTTKIKLVFSIKGGLEHVSPSYLLDTIDYASHIKISLDPPAEFTMSGSTVDTCYQSDSLELGNKYVECTKEFSPKPAHAVDLHLPTHIEMPDSLMMLDFHVFGPSGIPVDGQWSKIGEWQPCSNKCGSGNQTRTRTCTNPSPAYGGLECEGPSVFSRTCRDTTGCPTDWSVIAIIGWWQFALVIAIIVTKTCAWMDKRKDKKESQYAHKLVDDVFDDSASQESWGAGSRSKTTENSLTL